MRRGETIECYDRIAGRYAERWCATRLDAQLERFARLCDPGGRVLDLGCGPGRDIHHLGDLGFHAAGLDRSRGMLGEARARGCSRIARGDMRRLPFADSVFDGVWWTASMLHLPSGQVPIAVSEVSRVMRPGGALFVGVQAGAGEGWRPDPDGGRRFFCLFDADQLSEVLTRAIRGARCRRRARRGRSRSYVAQRVRPGGLTCPVAKRGRRVPPCTTLSPSTWPRRRSGSGSC